MKDWKTSLKNTVVVVCAYVALLLLLFAGLAFFRSIVGFIGALLVLSAIGLAYEGLKKAGGSMVGKARGRSSA